MAKTEHFANKRIRSLGDAAVDGLFGGLAAGVLMGVYLFFAGISQGISASEILGLLVGSRDISPTGSVLMHLAIGGIYGVLFGVGIHLSRLSGPAHSSTIRIALIGLGFGLLLALVARYLLLPGSGSLMESLNWLHLALAHLIYGLSLGVFTSIGLRRLETP